MSSTRTQVLVGVAMLALAISGGWAATTFTQRHVAIVGGVDGCWRLDGGARQADCLARQFTAGADRAAARVPDDERAEAIADYVRTADRRAAGDSRLAGQCHPAMHQLGRREGARAAKDGAAPTFPTGASQLCTAGYVHGLAEGYLSGTPNADVAAVFPTLCADAKARTGCAHGIGHAVLQARGSDPAREAVDGATARCAALPADVAPHCDNGVFMELAMRRSPGVIPVPRYVDTCTSRTDVGQQSACFGYLTLSFSTNEQPSEEIPATCRKAPSAVQAQCMESYGREIGPSGAPRCEAVGRALLQQRCIDGAMGLQVGSGHVTAAAAKRSCAKVSSEDLASYCTHAVDRYTAGRAEVEAGGD